VSVRLQAERSEEETTHMHSLFASQQVQLDRQVSLPSLSPTGFSDVAPFEWYGAQQLVVADKAHGTFQCNRVD